MINVDEAYQLAAKNQKGGQNQVKQLTENIEKEINKACERGSFELEYNVSGYNYPDLYMLRSSLVSLNYFANLDGPFLKIKWNKRYINNT